MAKSFEDLSKLIQYATDYATFKLLHLKLMQAMDTFLADLPTLAKDCARDSDQETIQALSAAVIDNQLYLRLAMLLFYCPLVFRTSNRWRDMIRKEAFEVIGQTANSSSTSYRDIDTDNDDDGDEEE
jgi:hypothetical protein